MRLAPVALAAAAALIVSAPIFYAAIRGVFNGDTDDIMEQLVALAVLAALVPVGFLAAVMIAWVQIRR